MTLRGNLVFERQSCKWGRLCKAFRDDKAFLAVKAFFADKALSIQSFDDDDTKLRLFRRMIANRGLPLPPKIEVE